MKVNDLPAALISITDNGNIVWYACTTFLSWPTITWTDQLLTPHSPAPSVTPEITHKEDRAWKTNAVQYWCIDTVGQDLSVGASDTTRSM